MSRFRRTGAPKRSMEPFIFDYRLASDEGPPFGHEGIGPWEEVGEELRAWLLRFN